jgi:aminopeptidase N
MRLAHPLPSFAAIATGFLLASCGANTDLTRAPPPPPVATNAEPAAPPPLPTGRLPGTARPLHYALSLIVDPTRDRFSGDVTIDVEVPATTRAIVLHGRDLTVVRAEALAGGDHVAAQITTRMSAGGKDTPEEMVLTLARPIPAGRAQLRVAYSGPLAESLSGLYRVRDGGAAYAFTQFEPTDARRMLPCFDEPGFKVPFDVKVTTPKGNVVVANTNELEHHDSEDGRSVTYSFATTPPMPTYLLALAVGPLEIREAPAGGPVPIRLVTTKGKSQLGTLALESSASLVAQLGAYFDKPYPFPKLDIVAVPDFGYGAMENLGLLTFREELLLVDPAASTHARRSVATVLAHELSHQWFGNLVTMKWWDDLWLNEGFATWMEAKIVDTWRPTMDARLDALGAKADAMKIDALDSSRAVRQPVTSTSDAEEAFDGITYDKGSSVLDMLETWLGEGDFRAGVRGYLSQHENGSASSADLFRALAQASKKDVWPIASTFLDQPGVPLVRAELSCDKGATKVALSQRRYRARRATDAERNDALWKIPVCVAYDGAPKDEAGHPTPACTLLEAPSAELALPIKTCPRWIYPNADEHGYYRSALPRDGIEALARAGKSLDARMRLGLVSNAWALVKSGDLGADVLLDLLAGMRRERSRQVVEQITATLVDVGQTLVDDASRPAFRAYASSILLPLAKELGWDARPRDTEDQRLMRRNVLGALATLTDDAWMVAEADKRAQKWLTDPKSIDADVASIAVRVSTRHAGDKRLAELERALEKAKAPEDRLVAAGALGAFADPAVLRRGLDVMLTDEVRTQDGFTIYNLANAWPESRPLTLAWLKERWPDLRRKLPGFVLARFAEPIASYCDAGARTDAAAFFGDALRDVEGADRRVRQLLETADLCIDLRAREGAAAKKRLGKGHR